MSSTFSFLLQPWVASFHHYAYRAHFRAIACQKYPSTCEWILESEPVVWWCARKNPSVLWISGSPGIGKSTFLTYLVDNLLKNRPHHEVGRKSAVISSFCIDRQNYTASRVLSVAIHQILVQFPEVQKQAFSYDSTNFFGVNVWRPSRGKSRPPHVLWNLFCKIVEEVKLDKLFLVVDALDECNLQSQNDLIQLFQGAVAQPLCIKILFSSRPNNEIKKIFSHCSARAPGLMRHEEAGNLEDHINQDIDCYIEGEVARIGDLKHLSPGERELIKKKLTNERSGVFLPVALLFREIEDEKIRTVAEILEDIPKDLQDLYRKLLDQISADASLERQSVFKYLMYSIVSLTPRDIAYACHVIEPCRGNDKILADGLDEAHLAQTKRHLQSLSTILKIRGDTETVSFIHVTSKQYLVQRALTVHAEDLLSKPWEAHRDIAIACLGLIVAKSDMEFPVSWTAASITQSRFRAIEGFPFLQYSLRYWNTHLKEAVDQIPEDEELDNRLMTCIQQFIKLWNFPPPGFRYTLLYYWGIEGLNEHMEGDISIIEVFSALGLTRCLKMLLDRHSETCRKVTPRIRRAVLFAIRGSHESAFDLLVKHFNITSLDGEEYKSIIVNSAWSGHFSLLAKTMRLRTPQLPELVAATTVAFTTGKRGTLNELTKDQTIFQLPDSQGRTALHLLFITNISFSVSEDERETSPKLMLAQALYYLEHGVDPNAKDRYGFTALHYVCWSPQLCKKELIEGLIKHGADPLLTTNGGLTPFHFAVHYTRQPEVIQMLLDATKNRLVHVKSKGQNTPLHWAVQRRFSTQDTQEYWRSQNGPSALILKLLILGGADPYVRNKRGFTAIQYARYGTTVPLLESLYENPDGAHSSALALRRSVLYSVTPPHRDRTVPNPPLALAFPPYDDPPQSSVEEEYENSSLAYEQDVDLGSGIVNDDESESFFSAAETIQTESSGRRRRRWLWRFWNPS